jgi:hypothetical protein
MLGQRNDQVTGLHSPSPASFEGNPREIEESIRSKGDQALFGKTTQAMKARWKVPDGRPLAEILAAHQAAGEGASAGAAFIAATRAVRAVSWACMVVIVACFCSIISPHPAIMFACIMGFPPVESAARVGPRAAMAKAEVRASSARKHGREVAVEVFIFRFLFFGRDARRWRVCETERVAV